MFFNGDILAIVLEINVRQKPTIKTCPPGAKAVARRASDKSFRDVSNFYK